MKNKWGILLLSLSFLSASFSLDAAAKNAKKKWTILVFLNADNNLEYAGYDDIQEMESVGSNENVNVVVQFDGLTPRGTERIYIEKTNDPVTGKQFRSPIVEQMEEQDMGSTDTLVDFISWGMKNYPAEKYFVILWNHGSGWSKDAGPVTKSISYDDTSGNHIRSNELANALDVSVMRTGNRIDILGFDACLMGMYEVGDSIAGMVDYMIASEEVEPGDGYPYDDFLRAFYKREEMTTLELIDDVVQEYGKSYSGGSQGSRAVTNSGIDLGAFEFVKKRLNKWLEEVHKAGISVESLRKSARNTQQYYDSYYRDLGDYVKRVMDSQTVAADGRSSRASSLGYENMGVLSASIALLKAIDEVVVSNFNSSRYSDSTGLAIYLPIGWGGYSPWNSSSARKAAYLDLKFAKTTTWTEHLDLLFLNK
jgi:hypothetical protein